jgi:hypothetical protein
MKLVLLLMLAAALTSAQRIPPCYDAGTPASLLPVPASGTFVCGPLVFTDFSANILSGLIDAVITPFGNFRFIDFTIQPTSPELGWSYSVTASSAETVGFIFLPPITHVGSGSPTVTEHFCTVSPCTVDDFLGVGSLTTSTTAGSGFAIAKQPIPLTLYVKVGPTDITGGTITAFETVFVTPEPATWLTLAVALLTIAVVRRRLS